MKKLIVLSLTLMLLISMTYTSGVAEEVEVEPARTSISLLPANSIIAIEANMDKLNSMGNCKPLMLVTDYIGKYWGALQGESLGLEAIENLSKIPFTGTACFGLVIAGRGVNGVFCAEVNGDAESELKNLFKGTQWEEANSDIAGVPVRYLEYCRSPKFYMAVLDNFIVLSEREAGVEACINAYNMDVQETYVGNPMWKKSGTWDNNTVMKGILDFSVILQAQPAAALFFVTLGAQDPTCVIYRLTEENGRFDEKVRMECLAPLNTPAFDLAGTGTIPEENSAIPDTAIVAVRLNASYNILWQWLIESAPALGMARHGKMEEADQFIAGLFGLPETLDLLAMFSHRVEAFFDYPEGTILPDYVISIDIKDPQTMDISLPTFAKNLNFSEVKSSKGRFYAVDQRELDSDFPWGLALGMYNSKLILTSNVNAATDAIDRAKVSPLVASQKFKAVMDSKPKKRSLDIFIAGKAFSGLLNLLRVVQRKTPKAEFPAGTAISNLADCGFVLTGGENSLEIISSGSATPMTFVMTIPVIDKMFRFIRSSSPTQRMRSLSSDLYTYLRTYYQEHMATPVTLFDLTEQGIFRASTFLKPGVKVPEGGLTEEFFMKNCIFIYFPGLDVQNEEERKLPIFVTRHAIRGIYYGCYANGRTFTSRGLQLERILAELNNFLATNYRIINDEVVGP